MAQVAKAEQDRRAVENDEKQRFDQVEYLGYQRGVLESVRGERDLTADESAKMQLIAKESKSLNPSTIKSIRASASIRPSDPAEGLLVKPTSAPRAPSQPYVGPSIAPVIGQKLSDLVSSIDPSFKLTPEAEEVLLSLADQFVDSVVEDSCKLATHRVTHGGKAGAAPPAGGVNPLVDVTDINLVLKEKWGISVPGLGKNNVNDNIIPMAEIGAIFRAGGVWEEGNQDKQQQNASGGGGKGKKRTRGK
ncbi:hypothetical protein TrRE_jg13431 [Triparma retinervis]|uniref:Transcription initiation factor TFIID subunit 12 domain-containing protein n=1 Tax=Triparma retinervis TaxID=2557542 RepID=A0A9W7GAG4_9STRA|nr:hypothetical protein TrRE_jg13431 [Triparma retinervis]